MAEFIERAAYYASRPVALVIGCGDMGMGCARVLGRRTRLVMVDIDADRLAQSVGILEHEGYTVTGHQCDISNETQVSEMGGFLAQYGGVRVLAHVAAVGNTPGGWRHVMEVDLLGVHLVANAVAPHMVAGGVAIFISSTGSYQCPVDRRIEGLIDDPFQSDWLSQIADAWGSEPSFLDAYYMAKQGMNRLAQRLAIEWGKREVRSISVSPGLINSTMGRTNGAMLPVYDGLENTRLGSRSEKAVTEIPLGRQGSVVEITSVVEFLASDAASFISGIDIPVDGGSTAMWRKLGVISR